MDDLSKAKIPGHRWLRYLLAGILLLGLLYAVPVKEIWGALRACHLVPLSLSIVILLGSRILASLRTKALTDSQRLSLSILRIFEISCASTLYGIVLPGSISGGIIRWYRFSQQKSNPSGALAVLAAERAVDYFVLALVGILFWIGDVTEDTKPMVVWGLAVVAIACLLINLYTFLYRHGSSKQPVLLTQQRLSRLPDFLVHGITGIVSSLAQFRALSRSEIFLLFAVSLIFHMVVTVSIYMIAISLDLGVSLVTVGWIRACTVLLTALPITPSGLGVREISSVLLLVPLGVPAAQAVAFSLLQLAGLLSIAVTGAIFEARRYLSAPMNEQKIGDDSISQHTQVPN